jgi:hypothetical protein
MTIGTKTITMKEVAKSLALYKLNSAEALYEAYLHFARGLFMNDLSEFDEVLKAEFESFGIK